MTSQAFGSRMAWRAFAPRWVGVALLAAALALGGCGGRADNMSTDSASPLGPAPLADGYAVWVSLEDAAPRLVAAAEADMWLGQMRQRGVASVYLVTRTAAGEVAWPSRTAPLLDNRGDQLWIATQAGRRVGVEIVAVFPAFLGPPEPGEEIVTYGWSIAERVARLKPWPETEAPRISPATRPARLRQLALLAELAREQVDALCVSHAGYPSMDADFSDAAREAFARDTGLATDDWPESIVRFEATADPATPPPPVAGIHNEAWRLWRAATVSSFLAEAAARARNEHARAGRGDLRLVLMAPGHYPLHLREGINWAAPDRAYNWVLTDLPEGAEELGVGHLYDEIVLETLVPMARAEAAAAQGLAWWSSVEGSLRVARPLVGDDKPLRAALAVFPYASLAEDPEGVGSGEEFSLLEQRAFAEALRAARESGRQPLVLDARAIEGFEAWELVDKSVR